MLMSLYHRFHLICFWNKVERQYGFGEEGKGTVLPQNMCFSGQYE